MNAKRILVVFLALALCSQALLAADDMDAALIKLADKLATQIKQNGKKRVAVLDFTDLQGNSSELGRYVAEQLTVNLVADRHDFNVLDRANLKSILDEHRLTAKGLVDPRNAKKLGEFAGVDALILGTMVPRDKEIELMAKIITTDTAEIVGAGRGSFAETTEIDKMLAKKVAPPPGSVPKEPGLDSGGSDFDAAKTAFDFGHLHVALTSFRVLQNGEIMATLELRNTGTQGTIRVALNHDSVGRPDVSLLDNLGFQYPPPFRVNGLSVRSISGYYYSPTATPDQVAEQQYQRMAREMAGARTIEAGNALTATMLFPGLPQTGRQVGSVFQLRCDLTVASQGNLNREVFKEHSILIRGIRPRESLTK